MRKNIRTINVSKQANLTEHRSNSKGRDGSKTLPNKKCHSEAVEVDRHQLQSEYEIAHQRTQKLESELDRSLETIQRQKEEIQLLRSRLQSHQTQHLEKILSSPKPDPDKTLDHRIHHRSDLWERDTNLNDSSTMLREKQRIIDRY